MKRSFTREAAWISLAIGVATIAYVASQRGHVPVRRQAPRPMRNYSLRSGFPRGLEASRGLAADAVLPADMLTPEALRPWT